LTKEDPQKTKTRKDDHLAICTDKNTNIEMSKSNGFEDLHFIHKALPEINFDDIDLSVNFLNFDLDYPIFISPITGGTTEAKKINKILARVASKFNIAMGVGSQRSAIEDPTISDTFSIVRKEAPKTFIAGNLGAIQFNNDYSIKQANEAIKMLDANALILHLNPLQEVIQPEGQTNFGDLIEKIEEICEKLEQPVIVKEVGSGISYDDAELLAEIGVQCIDVAGAGGTSWAEIEAIRANDQGYEDKQALGMLFKNWGIPTAMSTAEIGLLREDIQTISSGGIRNGIEAAKAIYLGGNLVGTALPILRAAMIGQEEVELWLNRFIQELKTTMFLIGAKNIDDLISAEVVYSGKLANWIDERGI
jgi:isopentenyl-diphosphate delta-isomerase